MAQPVKLSDALVLDARLISEQSQRSIAGQIEFWAKLGRAVERLLRTDELLALKRRGEERPLSEAVADVDSGSGRARLQAYLASRPYPHFEPSDKPGLLVKIDADGTRTLGRFVQREFRKVDA